MSIEQEYFSIKKDIEFIDIYDGENQWRNIYKVNENILFEKLIVTHGDFYNNVNRIQMFRKIYHNIQNIV